MRDRHVRIKGHIWARLQEMRRRAQYEINANLTMNDLIVMMLDRLEKKESKGKKGKEVLTDV